MDTVAGRCPALGNLRRAVAFSPCAVREDFGQRLAGEGRRALGHLFRRAGRDNVTARIASFRSQIDDPVGRLDHVQVVLDDQYRVAAIHKIVEHFQQQLNVREVKSGRRFVEQIQGFPGAAFDQFARQLDALGFAARERRRRLSELDVIQADVVQRLQFVAHVGNVLEQLQRLLDVHLEHIGDGLALELDLQRFVVVPMSLADRAGHPHIGEEIHFQAIRAVPFAGFAATARDVEAEPARLVAAPLGLGQLRE